jgi:hypothetical protein
MLSKRAFDAWVAKAKTKKRAKTFSADITDINGEDIPDVLVYKTDRDGTKHLQFINGWHLTRSDYPMRNKWSEDPVGYSKKYRDYVHDAYEPTFDDKGRVTNANQQMEEMNKFWASKGFKSTALHDKSPIRLMGDQFKPLYEGLVKKGNRTGNMSYISLLGGFYTWFLNSEYGKLIFNEAIKALRADGRDIDFKVYRGQKSERSLDEKVAYVKRSPQFASAMRNFLAIAFDNDRFWNTFTQSIGEHIGEVATANHMAYDSKDGWEFQ